MKERAPLVSIVMPTYNQAQYVEEALDSAVGQDYPNIEVVVRDDGSSDSTPAILDRYARKWQNRIKVLDGSVNLGITANANRILAGCRGKYVAFFAGDDVLLPGKISAQVEWLEKDRRRVLCHHDVDVFDSSTGRTLYLYSDRHPLRSGSVMDLVRYPNFCAAMAVMVRAESMPAHGFDSRLPRSSDWLFFMETLLGNGADAEGAGVVPGTYSRYRRHDGNVTNSTAVDGFEESVAALDILAERAPALATEIRVARSERTATYGFRAILGGRVTTGARMLMAATAAAPTGVTRALANAARYYSKGIGAGRRG